MSADDHWTGSPSTLLRVGAGFRLADVDPASTPGYDGDKKSGQADLAAAADEFDQLQERLYAQSRTQPDAPSVLLVLQGMDTSGKGGVTEKVVGLVSPLGVRIASFKRPTEEELAHDFLWRVEKQLPPAGHLGVFDRSHYEDVLIGRVRRLADDGLSVLAALHDLSLAAAYADHVVVLADGAVVAAGDPVYVLTTELIRAVWGVEATVLDHPVTGRPLIAFAPTGAATEAATALAPASAPASAPAAE